MSALNTTSKGLGTYEASFVKCDDPGSIIFDIHSEKRDTVAEYENFKELNRKITEYFIFHEDDPVEGRRHHIGEIVAVKFNELWKAGIIANFNLHDGLHYYEVVLLDSGQLVEVHRMAFRKLNEDDFKINHRFAYFGMMNLIPTGEDASSQSSWSVEACHTLKMMLDTASSIIVTVMARKKFSNSEKVFGNIVIHIGNHVIDVKEMMLNKKSAYYNKEAFQRIHQLTDKDYCDLHIEERPSCAPEPFTPVYEQLEVEHITDETLDYYLDKWWRRGGADPLTQEERLRACNKLSSEAKISFARHQSLVTTDSITSRRSISQDVEDVMGGECKQAQARKFLGSENSITSRRSTSQDVEDVMGDECKQAEARKFLGSENSVTSRRSVSQDVEDVMGDECKQAQGRKFLGSENSITSRRSIYSGSTLVEKESSRLTDPRINFQRCNSQDEKDITSDEYKQPIEGKFLVSKLKCIHGNTILKDSFTSRMSVSFSGSTGVEKESPILTDSISFQRSTSQNAKGFMRDECKQTKGRQFWASKDSITFQRSSSQDAKYFMGDEYKQTKGRNFASSKDSITSRRSYPVHAKDVMSDGERQTNGMKAQSSKVSAPRRERLNFTNSTCSDSDSDWEDRKESRKLDSDELESDSTSTSLRSVTIEHYDDEDVRGGIFSKKKGDSPYQNITVMSEEHEKKLLAIFQ